MSPGIHARQLNEPVALKCRPPAEVGILIAKWPPSLRRSAVHCILVRLATHRHKHTLDAQTLEHAMGVKPHTHNAPMQFGFSVAAAAAAAAETFMVRYCCVNGNVCLSVRVEPNGGEASCTPFCYLFHGAPRLRLTGTAYQVTRQCHKRGLKCRHARARNQGWALMNRQQIAKMHNRAVTYKHTCATGTRQFVSARGRDLHRAGTKKTRKTYFRACLHCDTRKPSRTLCGIFSFAAATAATLCSIMWVLTYANYWVLAGLCWPSSWDKTKDARRLPRCANYSERVCVRGVVGGSKSVENVNFYFRLIRFYLYIN